MVWGNETKAEKKSICTSLPQEVTGHLCIVMFPPERGVEKNMPAKSTKLLTIDKAAK